MKLIIGLGNPGKQYEKTRHNVGFITADFLMSEMKWGNLKLNKKFKAEIGETKFGGQKIIIAKPLTFMNNSGESVRLLALFYKIRPENIMVIYDELDLPFGTVRVRDSGSSAGHKGIESIIGKLGTDKFNRIRIGIRNDKSDKIPADKFVLSRFSLIERMRIKKEILPRALEELKKILAI